MSKIKQQWIEMKFNSKDLETNIKTTTVTADLCECGRLYKDRRDETGKMICSLCYTDSDIETLKKLWSV